MVGQVRECTWDDLGLLQEVSKPLWLYSCERQKNVWANQAALELFGMTDDEFYEQDFSRPAALDLSTNELAAFGIMNSVIHDQVEVRCHEQQLPGSGFRMLPGAISGSGQNLQMDLTYKPMKLRQDGESSVLTLVQVIKGQEVHVLRGGPGKATRLFHQRLRQLADPIGLASLDAATPVGKMLEVLEDILAGEEVNVEDVTSLHQLIISGEFSTGQTRAVERVIKAENLDRDVNANLMQLLGAGAKRRRSSCSSIASEESAYTARLAETSTDEDMLDNEEEMEAVPGSLVPEVEEFLRGHVEKWQFDAFRLAEVTQGHPLSMLAYFLMDRNYIIRDFDLDPHRLARFLRRVEDGYPDNPYHNRMHAADVLQTMHMLLTVGGLQSKAGDDMIMLQGYLAAICHDLDHKGVNNDFLRKSSHPLALLYNDVSPLENHHAAEASLLMLQKDADFMRRMARDKKAKLRKMMIQVVLATDMERHFTILNTFQDRQQVQSHLPAAGGQERQSPPTCEAEEEAARILMLQMALKCADLGHLAAPWEVHTKWVACLEEELFRQGDQEREQKLPISPLMNRCHPGITKSQVGFFHVVALPLFRGYVLQFPDAFPLLQQVEANDAGWKDPAIARAASAALPAFVAQTPRSTATPRDM
ncbi:hypothetical protein WJX72_004187 [[Myrmecia] bisecta]|uniref:Phosphodiesterase n=1 Tax=[Myrmecia] bisecta TaxID=41462 RepID=A0AAW1PPN7_9CHLO